MYIARGSSKPFSQRGKRLLHNFLSKYYYFILQNMTWMGSLLLCQEAFGGITLFIRRIKRSLRMNIFWGGRSLVYSNMVYAEFFMVQFLSWVGGGGPPSHAYMPGYKAQKTVLCFLPVSNNWNRENAGLEGRWGIMPANAISRKNSAR